MLLDKADGPPTVRGDTIANCVDHPAFDVVESLRVLTPFRSAPRGCTPARFTPVIGISVAFFGLVLVSRKVGVSQDLPDVFGPRPRARRSPPPPRARGLERFSPQPGHPASWLHDSTSSTRASEVRATLIALQTDEQITPIKTIKRYTAAGRVRHRPRSL